MVPYKFPGFVDVFLKFSYVDDQLRKGGPGLLAKLRSPVPGGISPVIHVI